MARITEESRRLFDTKMQPYKAAIQKIEEDEKRTLLTIGEGERASMERVRLCEQLLYSATLYALINNVSVALLGARNTDALNDGRKALYKAVIYLEEVVSPFIDSAYSEYEDKVALIAAIPLSRRYYLIRKLGLAIDLIIDGFGDNTKWKWSFVELQGRYAAVTKNFVDLRQLCKIYFEHESEDYDTAVFYLRLIKKLLSQSGEGYRDRYELSTRRLDDMGLAIRFVLALRRVCVMLGDVEESEDLKKKAEVWHDKMEEDRKRGHNQ